MKNTKTIKKLTLAEIQGVEDALLKESLKFLQAHGGMPNGYETGVTGYLRANTIGSLEINLPDQNLSKKQLRNLGYELYDILSALAVKLLGKEIYIELHAGDYVFNFYSVHTEYGCRNQYVVFAK